MAKPAQGRFVRRGSDIIAKLEKARGPAKKNKNKESKASMRAAS